MALTDFAIRQAKPTAKPWTNRFWRDYQDEHGATQQARTYGSPDGSSGISPAFGTFDDGGDKP